MPSPEPLMRLEFSSCMDMLELVQTVADQVGRLAGLDEDALHCVSVAVRESVINAVKHGNRNDRQKRVIVEFHSGVQDGSAELTVLVRDEGPGFDPSALADPLSADNILKADGRGVFLIQSFMDEVVIQRAPQGGMEVRMVKRSHR
jgi:serine/threonine-protein kinase RsbW